MQRMHADFTRSQATKINNKGKQDSSRMLYADSACKIYIVYFAYKFELFHSKMLCDMNDKNCKRFMLVTHQIIADVFQAIEANTLSLSLAVIIVYVLVDMPYILMTFNIFLNEAKFCC